MVRALVAAATLALLAAPAGAEPRTFIIPDDDGYGLGDCLTQGPTSSCGRMVADAWCVTQGHGRAAGFGRSDAKETTATVGSSIPVKAGALFVTCE